MPASTLRIWEHESGEIEAALVGKEQGILDRYQPCEPKTENSSEQLEEDQLYLAIPDGLDYHLAAGGARFIHTMRFCPNDDGSDYVDYIDNYGIIDEEVETTDTHSALHIELHRRNLIPMKKITDKA